MRSSIVRGRDMCPSLNKGRLSLLSSSLLFFRKFLVAKLAFVSLRTLCFTFYSCFRRFYRVIKEIIPDGSLAVTAIADVSLLFYNTHVTLACRWEAHS